MEKDKKILKTYSSLFLILAGINVYNLIYTLVFNMPDISELNISKEVFIAISIGIITIIVLAELFLGIKGLKQAKGKAKGMGHITLAKVAFAFYVIGTIMLVVDFINKKQDVISLLTSIGSALIIYLYIKSAKALKENK